MVCCDTCPFTPTCEEIGDFEPMSCTWPTRRTGEHGIRDPASGRPAHMTLIMDRLDHIDVVLGSILDHLIGDTGGDGRHPDECECQFCDEDRREALAADDPIDYELTREPFEEAP